MAAGDGVVLFDTGMHEPGSMAQLERALEMVNLRLEHVRLVVCTHAHSDHYGQAATVVERAGLRAVDAPQPRAHDAHGRRPGGGAAAPAGGRAHERRPRGAAAGATPSSAAASPTASPGSSSPTATCVDGVTVETDLGAWIVHETPGHAPSHVCLFQPERRLLHLRRPPARPRQSLYFDYGYTPDPAGEFLHSLDVVEDLDARLCLAGHGRTFTDVQAHIAANRRLVAERVQRVLDVVTFDGPITAFDAVPRVYGEAITPLTANWWLSETLCYLRHLEVTGRARARSPRTTTVVERWRAAA